jgi:hypothetical protein
VRPAYDNVRRRNGLIVRPNVDKRPLGHEGGFCKASRDCSAPLACRAPVAFASLRSHFPLPCVLSATTRPTPWGSIPASEYRRCGRTPCRNELWISPLRLCSPSRWRCRRAQPTSAACRSRRRRRRRSRPSAGPAAMSGPSSAAPSVTAMQPLRISATPSSPPSRAASRRRGSKAPMPGACRSTTASSPAAPWAAIGRCPARNSCSASRAKAAICASTARPSIP